jgi:dihydroorotate dehydrogenase
MAANIAHPACVDVTASAGDALGVPSQVGLERGVVYNWLRRVLFLLPAETAHHVAFWFLRVFHAFGFLRTTKKHLDSSLKVNALGLEFPSPLGLAAGFDKNALGYDALGELGFGFVEIGTVTHEAQPGNPRPRLFRLPSDRAVINRMGFNNDGALKVKRRLNKPRTVIVGVNIGKTKRVDEEDAIKDYQGSAALLAVCADYLVVNVSSPNTPGLRSLQAVEKLEPLLKAVQTTISEVSPERRVPLLVKIAPDLSDEDVSAVARLAVALKLDGIIATNTTLSRSGLRTPENIVEACGAGGLSGAPLKQRALAVWRQLRAQVGAEMVLIGAGGIESAADVLERVEAGATLVQMYTGFIYGGPRLPARINAELAGHRQKATRSL